MRWFVGSIPDAIQTSKQRKTIFIVYVHGKDEMSEQMAETWEAEPVSSLCDTQGVVAIRIEANSEDGRNFSQIYPVVVVPSTFFIGEGGVPLEVTGGHLGPEEFVQKIQTVIELHNQQKESEPAVPVPQQAAASREATMSSPGEASQGANSVPLENRMERAKQLMEEKKREKERQEKEKRKNEEIERRRLGQDVQKLKQFQREMELKDVKDQIKKEKEEEKKARERTRELIARDRELEEIMMSVPAKAEKVQRTKRIELTFQQKLELIHHSEGRSQRQLASQFGVGRTQVCALLKKKDELLQMAGNSEFDFTRKRISLGNKRTMEVNMMTYEWFLRSQTLSVPLNGPIVQQKAKEFAKYLGIEDFKASNGWLDSFRKRHNIQFSNKHYASETVVQVPDSSTTEDENSTPKMEEAELDENESLFFGSHLYGEPAEEELPSKPAVPYSTPGTSYSDAFQPLLDPPPQGEVHKAENDLEPDADPLLMGAKVKEEPLDSQFEEDSSQLGLGSSRLEQVSSVDPGQTQQFLKKTVDQSEQMNRLDPNTSHHSSTASGNENDTMPRMPRLVQYSKAVTATNSGLVPDDFAVPGSSREQQNSPLTQSNIQSNPFLALPGKDSIGQFVNTTFCEGSSNTAQANSLERLGKKRERESSPEDDQVVLKRQRTSAGNHIVMYSDFEKVISKYFFKYAAGDVHLVVETGLVYNALASSDHCGGVTFRLCLTVNLRGQVLKPVLVGAEKTVKGLVRRVNPRLFPVALKAAVSGCCLDVAVEELDTQAVMKNKDVFILLKREDAPEMILVPQAVKLISCDQNSSGFNLALVTQKLSRLFKLQYRKRLLSSVLAEMFVSTESASKVDFVDACASIDRACKDLSESEPVLAVLRLAGFPVMMDQSDSDRSKTDQSTMSCNNTDQSYSAGEKTDQSDRNLKCVDAFIAEGQSELSDLISNTGRCLKAASTMTAEEYTTFDDDFKLAQEETEDGTQQKSPVDVSEGNQGEDSTSPAVYSHAAAYTALKNIKTFCLENNMSAVYQQMCQAQQAFQDYVLSKF